MGGFGWGQRFARNSNSDPIVLCKQLKLWFFTRSHPHFSKNSTTSALSLNHCYYSLPREAQPIIIKEAIFTLYFSAGLGSSRAEGRTGAYNWSVVLLSMLMLKIKQLFTSLWSLSVIQRRSCPLQDADILCFRKEKHINYPQFRVHGAASYKY